MHIIPCSTKKVVYETKPQGISMHSLLREFHHHQQGWLGFHTNQQPAKGDPYAIMNIENMKRWMKLKHQTYYLTSFRVLTQLSVLKVKLADTHENGTWSNAAIAPASLFFIIASYAIDDGTSERLDIFLVTNILPTKLGASKGPWQLNTTVTEPAIWSRKTERTNYYFFWKVNLTSLFFLEIQNKST